MRTFVAVEVSDSRLIENIKNLQSKIKIKAKPVSSQNLHFTLQFLGEISDENSDKIRDSLKTIEFPKFTLKFEGIGVFPKPKFPRVVWIGTDNDGGKKLVDLAQKVGNILEPLGFKKDKPFKPHMTIFRIKNKIGDISDELENYKSHSFGVQEINNIKFKQSVLTPSGPVYSDLEVIELR